MTELPEFLKVKLANLRADPHFTEIVKACPRTRIVPFSPTQDREKAVTKLIFDSGRIAGERAILLWVLGYDPDDRQSE